MCWCVCCGDVPVCAGMCAEEFKIEVRVCVLAVAGVDIVYGLGGVVFFCGVGLCGLGFVEECCLFGSGFGFVACDLDVDICSYLVVGCVLYKCVGWVF